MGGTIHPDWARYQALNANEKRLVLALAAGAGSVYEERVRAAVGLKKGSVGKTLEALVGHAEVIRVDGRPVIADPLFEHWLAEKGALLSGAAPAWAGRSGGPAPGRRPPSARMTPCSTPRHHRRARSPASACST